MHSYPFDFFIQLRFYSISLFSSPWFHVNGETNRKIHIVFLVTWKSLRMKCEVKEGNKDREKMKHKLGPRSTKNGDLLNSVIVRKWGKGKRNRLLKSKGFLFSVSLTWFLIIIIIKYILLILGLLLFLPPFHFLTSR